MTRPATKRVVLQAAGKVFDPLGLCAAVTVRAKMLIQQMWKEKIDWDTQIPESMGQTFKEIGDDLSALGDIKLPRFVGPAGIAGVELHCFSDASALAYGACVYLKFCQSERVHVHLLLCKNRLAPVKAITIPRLELMAAVVGIRILRFVEEALKLPILKRVLWPDSKCVLYWLNSKQLQPVFVQNRLNEILALKNVMFRYVPTGDNPADFPSRGKTAADLRDSKLWWFGPPWLVDEDKWPVWMPTLDSTVSHSDSFAEPPQASLAAVQVGLAACPLGIDLARFSSLGRVLRVTVYCLRFVKSLQRSLETDTTLTVKVNELGTALKLWERCIQNIEFRNIIVDIKNGRKNETANKLRLFLDDEGVIRCEGRLENSDLPEETKYPILLPKGHILTRLIIQDCHNRLLHAGAAHTLSEIRQKYWIASSRREVLSVIRKCCFCRVWKGGSYKAPRYPALPAGRVSCKAPFDVTGVDYLGPLYVTEYKAGEPSSQKVYVCLFTCAAIRAIHLEVATSLTSEAFLSCFRRFVSRRGKPSVLISDNSKTLKLSHAVLSKFGAETVPTSDIQTYMAAGGIDWRFISEYAPWMGGFYERLIGLVKDCLKRLIGRSKMSLPQLITIITEIEGLLNSRPLTYVGSDLKDGPALTPNHFLGNLAKVGLPSIVSCKDKDPEYTPFQNQSSASALLAKWKKGQRLLDQFWAKWRSEYLTALREQREKLTQKGSVDTPPKVNDVVLIKEALPRGSWRMGKIVDLSKGNDSKVRRAGVQLAHGGVIFRPLKLLVPLEVVD